MDISELAKRTNIASSKIRYYENIGLIKSIGRKGLRRVFPESIIQKLSFIALLQSCNFSLDEISSMQDGNGQFFVDRELLKKKISDLENQINSLQRSQKCIKHLNNCKEKDHFQCTRFQKLMKAALFG